MSILPFKDLLAKAGQTDYDALWKKVEKSIEEDLPRNTLEQSEQIFKKAQRDDQFAHMLKAWRYILATQIQLDPELFDLSTLRPVPHEGAVRTALYDAMLAYTLQHHAWQFYNRNDASMLEHLDSADSLYAASIADVEALSAVSAADYVPLVLVGSEAWPGHDDLLGLLTRFAFDNADWDSGQKAEIAQRQADFYMQRGNREAATLMRLQQYHYQHLHSDYNQRLLQEQYQALLSQLLEQSLDLTAYADVAEAYVAELMGDAQADFCRQALDHQPKVANAKFFRNTLDLYLRPELKLNLSDNILADRPFLLTLKGTNLTECTFTVRRFVGYADQYETRPKLSGKIITQRQYTLAQDSLNTARREQGYSTCDEQTDSLTLPAGRYVFVTQGAGQQDASVVTITSLRMLALRQPDNKILLVVRHNETGRPVPGAKVRRFDYHQKHSEELACNAAGELLLDYDDKLDRCVAFLPGTDDETSQIYLRDDNWNRPTAAASTVIQLFTDRAIYRPGQTLHVAGICYRQEGDQTQVLSHHEVTLELRNPQYQTVTEVKAVSGELGTFDADIVLPTSLLPGLFSLSCSNDSRISFRIEEYKRPTFQVEARASDAGGRTFSFGDTIQVEALARTYAGVPVQGARTHYKVETAQVSFWRWWYTNWQLLSEGDVTTSDEGLASLPLLLDPTKLSSRDGVVQYRVTFDVTDQAGETRSDAYTFCLSRRSFALQAESPSVLDLAASDQHIVIRAINANHEPVQVSGSYTLHHADSDEVIATGTFCAGQPLTLPALPAGDYQLRAKASDRDDTDIECQHMFSLFDSRQALAPARFSFDFLHVTHSTFSEDQDAEIFFSPSEADAYVSCLILANDRVIEHRHLTLDQQVMRLRLAYRPEMSQGVSVLFYYVRNGHLCQQRTTLTYVRPDKRLLLSWSTFRDRLYPGQDEEWTLTVSHPDGSPVGQGEMLATMYDASLDAIQPHRWNFDVSFDRYVRRYQAYATQYNASYGCSLSGNISYPSRVQHTYSTLDTDEPVFLYSTRNRRNRIQYYMPADAMPMMLSKASAPIREDRLNITENLGEVTEAVEEVVAEEARQPQADEAQLADALRTNFAETAFFYPHLRTDAQGRVAIAFTLPESLTQWHFMGLAHDADLNYGFLSGQAQARKDFMVQPNLPRFVREGDAASISARVINQCDQSLSGHVRLRLLDAETEEVVYTAQQPVQVTAGQTSAVTFAYEVTDRWPMLICEIIGTARPDGPEARTSSDGERQFLPVLTSRRYLTEAIPFFVLPTDTVRQVDVSSLFNGGSPTATQRRLVFEFTQCPEWTAIQALDGIKLPTTDNAPAFAASLYANMRAAQLAASIPGFEQALRVAAEREAAQPASQLQLDADLRQLLLHESPWVIDALGEAEQRARLLDLFDAQHLDERSQQAFTRLEELQQADGSWSWFKGMSGSYYITLTVCEHLVGLYGTDLALDNMLLNALSYLDEQEYRSYQEQRKVKVPLYVGEGTMHYLYVCSLLPERTVGSHISRMRNEMLKVIAKSVRQFTILGRCQAACVLRTFGKAKDADHFVESAVQYSVTSPGMGRYFTTDDAYYSWLDYRIPTQLAAMRAIAASTRADKEALLRDMKVWLLRQKQTQMWDNPINTLGCVDFLLSYPASGAQRFAQTPSLPVVRLDGESLPMALDESRFLAPQLGYVHTELPDSLALRQPGTLSIDLTANGTQPAYIAWGALYAQYLESLESLKPQSTGELSIEVQWLDAKGQRFQPATTLLHVGDRIQMRLVIKADRDMDFVHVNCQRPACFEPVNQRSGFCWLGDCSGYVAQHDASTDLFFDRFTRGTTTIDLTFNVDRAGQYLTGIATAQCAYAPEFGAHSEAVRVQVKR